MSSREEGGGPTGPSFETESRQAVMEKQVDAYEHTVAAIDSVWSLMQLRSQLLPTPILAKELQMYSQMMSFLMSQGRGRTEDLQRSLKEVNADPHVDVTAMQALTTRNDAITARMRALGQSFEQGMKAIQRNFDRRKAPK